VVDPNDMAVMFDTAFHSLEKSLGAQLDPALRAQFRALGVDFEHLQAAYPMETWEACLQLVWRGLYPTLSQEEAWRAMGRRFVEGYAQTRLGQATVLMGKVVGVRRMVHRMERHFHAATNTVIIVVRDLGERVLELEMSMNPQFLPTWRGQVLSTPWHRFGLLEGLLSVLGITGWVELLEVDPQLQRTLYRVNWQ
jgi:uncharacterized protein (TIGR02265 family)